MFAHKKGRGSFVLIKEISTQYMFLFMILILLVTMNI
jgi:hypothetical protein